MKKQISFPLNRKLKRIIVTKDNLQEAIDDIAENKVLSYDCETSGLDQRAPGSWVTSLGISTSSYDWCFLLNHYQSPLYNKFNAQKRLIKKLDKVVAGKRLVAQNGKFDYLWMRIHFGVKWEIFFDTLLAHYNLNENSPHGLKEQVVELGWDDGYDIPLDEKRGITGCYKRHCDYLAKDTFFTLNLYYLRRKAIKQDFGTYTTFWEITMPTCRLYSEAQYRGVYVDKSKLGDAKLFWMERMNNAKNKLDSKYSEMPDAFHEDKIEKAYRKKHKKEIPDADLIKAIEKAKKKPWKNKLLNTKEFGVNWGSSQQLAWILFEEEGIDPVKATPGGADSTDESVLLQLGKTHEIPKLVLEYREACKNIGTFINGWATKLHNSRVYPNFKIFGTVTGRPSCEEPNLQQTPRDPRIRSLITAPPGKILLDIDYSQAELRIIAEVSQDPALCLAYQTGIDVHGLTVERLFGIPQSKQTKEERKKGKAVNFGFVYGMWWKKFIQYALDNYDTVFSEKEAEKIRKDFFRLYKLESWHKKQKEFAMRNGYVRNLLGRKRRLPDAQRENTGGYDRLRDEALRQAINSPIQSFASDLTLMAAVQISQEFPEETLAIVGSVHDSILMELDLEADVDKVCNRLLEIMKKPALLDKLQIDLSVPLEGEIELGPWGAGKQWLPKNQRS